MELLALNTPEKKYNVPYATPLSKQTDSILKRLDIGDPDSAQFHEHWWGKIAAQQLIYERSLVGVLGIELSH